MSLCRSSINRMNVWCTTTLHISVTRRTSHKTHILHDHLGLLPAFYFDEAHLFMFVFCVFCFTCLRSVCPVLPVSLSIRDCPFVIVHSVLVYDTVTVYQQNLCWLYITIVVCRVTLVRNQIISNEGREENGTATMTNATYPWLYVTHILCMG